MVSGRVPDQEMFLNPKPVCQWASQSAERLYLGAAGIKTNRQFGCGRRPRRAIHTISTQLLYRLARIFHRLDAKAPGLKVNELDGRMLRVLAPSRPCGVILCCGCAAP